MAGRLQFDFEHNSIEDRLLLRISEKESHGMCIEYRAWFTQSFTPTGEEPILITKLNLKKKSKNKYVLSFLSNENAGINITADIDLIHTIRKMLHASVKNAGWNQPLFQSTEEEVEAGESKMLIS